MLKLVRILMVALRLIEYDETGVVGHMGLRHHHTPIHVLIYRQVSTIVFRRTVAVVSNRSVQVTILATVSREVTASLWHYRDGACFSTLVPSLMGLLMDSIRTCKLLGMGCRLANRGGLLGATRLAAGMTCVWTICLIVVHH